MKKLLLKADLLKLIIAKTIELTDVPKPTYVQMEGCMFSHCGDQVSKYTLSHMVDRQDKVSKQTAAICAKFLNIPISSIDTFDPNAKKQPYITTLAPSSTRKPASSTFCNDLAVKFITGQYLPPVQNEVGNPNALTG
jgi:hypothetical protein